MPFRIPVPRLGLSDLSTAATVAGRTPAQPVADEAVQETPHAATPAADVPSGWEVVDAHATARVPRVGDEVTEDTPGEAESPTRRFLHGAWTNLNPMGIATALTDPVGTADRLLEAHKAQFRQAKQLYDQGRYSEAVGHLGAGLLPIAGPAAAAAGERIGAGDIAGGLGEAAGLVAGTAASTVTPRLARTGTKLAARLPATAVRTAAKVGDVIEAHPGLATATGAAIGYAHGGVAGAVEGALGGGMAGRMLRAAQRVRAAQTGLTSAGPPRLAGKAPSLQTTLTDILEEAHREPEAAGTAPSVPGGAPGGAEAARETMRMLAEGPPLASRLRAAASREPQGAPRPPSAAAHATAPLNVAAQALRTAAGEKIKLSAEEFQAGVQMIRHGHDASEVLAGLQAVRTLRESPSFANLPTDEDVARVVAEKNARTTRPYGGTIPASNPFR